MKLETTHSLVKALRAVPGFDVLDDTTLLKIVGASVNLFWPAGSIVFEKGTEGEALYVVLSGCVRVYDDVDGVEVEVALTRPGDYFGEMSLILETKHSKSVRAVADTELLVLPKRSFRALLASKSEMAALVHRRLEERTLRTAQPAATEVAAGKA